MKTLFTIIFATLFHLQCQIASADVGKAVFRLHVEYSNMYTGTYLQTVANTSLQFYWDNVAKECVIRSYNNTQYGCTYDNYQTLPFTLGFISRDHLSALVKESGGSNLLNSAVGLIQNSDLSQLPLKDNYYFDKIVLTSPSFRGQSVTLTISYNQ